MEIQTIGPSAFTLLLTEAELRRRRLRAAELSAEEAAELVRAELSGAGLASDGTMQLTLFPGRHEVLLLARFARTEPRFFVFPQLEELLSAVCLCRNAPPASLFLLDGVYILAVFPWPDCCAPAPLYAYGRPLQLPAGFLAHLEEHGQKLAAPDAVNLLRESFG